MEFSKKTVVLYDVALMEDQPLSSASSASYRDMGGHTTLKVSSSVHETLTTSHDPPHAFVASPSIAVTKATATSRNQQKYRVLGTLGLTGIMYFTSCGGPIGSEPLMSAGGPLVGLLGIVTYVAFCVIPLLVMVTELCCAFPDDGGFAVWAMNAFGPFWGFQSGYWAWIALIFNNAIYPGLIFDAITQAYGITVTSKVATFMIKATIAIVLALPTYFSVRSVGIAAVTMLEFVLFTWTKMILWSYAAGDGVWYRLGQVRQPADATDDRAQGGIDWTLLIHTLHWCFNGLYLISTVGGVIINPARTIPRVLTLSLSLSIFTFAVVWFSAIPATTMSWLTLTQTSLPDVANAIGGSFLHQLTLVASIIALVGLFVCSFFNQTFLVQGMAHSQLLPSVFRKRHARFKTPKYAVYLSLVATLALLGVDFKLVLTMTNACSAGVEMLMALTMLQLRYSFPYLTRPIKMPENTIAIALALLPVTCVYVFLIITTLQKSRVPLILLAFVVTGSLFPLIRARMAGYRICKKRTWPKRLYPQFATLW